MPPYDFQRNLEKYAEVLVKIGLNVQPGQRVLISGAPPAAVQFVRAVVTQAYQAGARYVDVLWNDEQLDLIRFQHAPRDSFEEYPTWRTDVAVAAAARGDAFLSLSALTPDLLRGQDPELVAIAQRIGSQRRKPVIDIAINSVTNWLVACVSVAGWSAKVFPNLPPEQREAQLWDVLFKICRIDQEDPVAAWQGHIRALKERSAYLNHKRYTALRYHGPGTNLTIGLPEGHLWSGTEEVSRNGITFTANIPTEEVFTLPHKDKINGVVSATKPLNMPSGVLIEDFSLTFKAGRVIASTARVGEDTLHNFLALDEGARSLGEVALVPHSSPISQSNLLFYNGLLDENAACHLALGAAYPNTLQGGPGMSAEAFAAAGGNQSLVHLDFMIGSGQLDVDGIREGDIREPILRGGEWVF